MKRLLLVCILTAVLAPLGTLAFDGNNGGNYGGDGGYGVRHHHHISATEMATGGFAVAALLGIGGFLVLRRRAAK